MLTNPYVDPRCSHTSAHGKRCTLLRQNTSSFCQMHIDQQRRFEEDDLAAGQLLGSVDDLKTAAQVNDALRRLFQLLARRRIPPRNAAILAYICQLLLSNLSLMERQKAREDTICVAPEIAAGKPALSPSPDSAEKKSAPATYPMSYWEDPERYNYWKAGLPIEPAEDASNESRPSDGPEPARET